ncbi:MAG: aminotransferase class IV, partial [Nevskiales bacterium]
MDIACLDGQYLPLAEARVPVLDRGYLFADGVYEVMPVYAGRIFALDAHLDRLDFSLNAIQLPNPLTRDAWREMLNTLVTRNGGGEQMLYLQVSRGVQPKRSFGLPDKPAPCVLAFCQPLPLVSDAIQRNGVSVISREDTRWLNCHIKSIALLGAVLLSHDAIQAGCNEVILLRDGLLTEGGSSNVFVVKNSRVVTPPKSRLILAGITRELVIDSLRAAGPGCEERAVSEAELRQADEIWITSSTREIFPVTRLDDHAV